MGAVTQAVSNLLTRGARTSPKNLPPSAPVNISSGGFWGPNGTTSKLTAYQLRSWAKHSEWVRGAITIRRSQVASADWQVVPYDKTKAYSKRLQKELQDFFSSPNPKDDSFRTLIEPIIEDLLVLDAGCIEKERNLMGGLVALWPVDGATMRVNALWDGSNPDEARYFWYPDHQERARFKSNEFIYMMANGTSYSPVGMSPIETLALTIEAELYGHEYNARQVRGAAPDGVLNLGEGFSAQQVREFRAQFQNEVAGGEGAIGFIGGTKDPGWIEFRKSNRDMQFLEWQVYLVRKIAVVMGLSPQDLGVTFDVNRSTAEIQLQVSEDRGLRPLMSLIQDYLTEEVVWDKGFGGAANNLAFRFTALNLRETTAKAQINEMALGKTPWKTPNEARIEDGRQPLKGDEYDDLIVNTPQGLIRVRDVPTMRELIELQAQSRAQPGGDSPKPKAPPKG